MKKIFLALISTTLIISNLRAQDLIVTNSGDSLNCKIIKITKDYIYFTFMYNAEIRNTLLPVNQVSTQQKDYFSTSEVPAHYTYKDVFPHFRLAIDGGWQYRTPKLESGMEARLREHYQKMKSGFHYDIQAAYFFIESQGVELMFSQQMFGHRLGYGELTDENGSIIASGNVNNTITFDYIGINYVLRLFDSQKKNSWLFSIGLGYMGFNERLFSDNVESWRRTASTLGSNIAIGYDFKVSKDFDIGLKLSLLGGSFNRYKKTFNGITTNETMSEKTSEGLGTVKLSVGLRFNK
jgi:hypothetical protein